jgi:hypothetical protein
MASTQDSPESVEEALYGLGDLLKPPHTTTAEETRMTLSIPDDLARDGGGRTILLGREEVQALSQVKGAIEGDLRFEHLGSRVGDPLKRQLNRLVCQCVVEPEADHIGLFIAEHEWAPRDRTCFLGVEFLKVDQRFDLFGIALLPVEHEEVPKPDGWFSLDSPIAAVAAVPVSGTHLKLMKDRAQVIAEQGLTLLRVALREHRYLNAYQLRFRLSEGYSFGDKLAGWETRPDARWEVTLDPETAELAQGQAMAALAGEPQNSLEEHARKALSWIDEGLVESDPLKSLLFLFFALEAILGTKSEGSKGHGLAFRRALLSVATRQHFANPDRTYFLYDQVRSAAVHGEDVPDVTEEIQRKLLWDVRLALNEYLELASREDLKTRKAVLRFLNCHPDRQRLEELLIEQHHANWKEFSPTQVMP